MHGRCCETRWPLHHGTLLVDHGTQRCRGGRQRPTRLHACTRREITIPQSALAPQLQIAKRPLPRAALPLYTKVELPIIKWATPAVEAGEVGSTAKPRV